MSDHHVGLLAEGGDAILSTPIWCISSFGWWIGLKMVAWLVACLTEREDLLLLVDCCVVSGL